MPPPSLVNNSSTTHSPVRMLLVPARPRLSPLELQGGVRMLTTRMRRPLILATAVAGLLLTAAAPAMASSTDHKTVWIGDIPYAAGTGWVDNHNTAVACDQSADGRGIRTEY